MRTWRWYSKVLLALLLAAFAYFVWPTPWRYEGEAFRQMRLHRVTGRVEILRGGEWKDWAAESKRRAQQLEEALARAPLRDYAAEDYPAQQTPLRDYAAEDFADMQETQR